MTPIPSDIVTAMMAWRRDLHAHPELAYKEFRTSDLVARELKAMGIAVHRGLGRTGVVGTLTNGHGPVIGLRADMDALPVAELNTFGHCSRHPQVMHACGHDGHTAMLLGAAKHLAEHPDFCGTVHFIFQPAEEGHGGGQAMIEDGLFLRFPCDAVYGLHNWPGLPAGQFAIIHGPMMAALDTFEIEVRGCGSHAAMPEQGIDPFIPAAQIVLALQTISSRALSAMESAVVSVTQVHGGDAWNVIPDTVLVRGTVRCFTDAIQGRIEASLRTVCQSTAEAHGATATITYKRCYPPTVNTFSEAEIAIGAARAVAGTGNVQIDCRPSLASEDFAFMLKERPGAYIWMGVDGPVPCPPLHNPSYDFNDDTLALGAAYWVTLAKAALETQPDRVAAGGSTGLHMTRHSY